jgi:hypothetical protein
MKAQLTLGLKSKSGRVPPTKNGRSAAHLKTVSVSVQHNRIHADPVRAAANIADWASYLPADCVLAMIRDGWHLSV